MQGQNVVLSSGGAEIQEYNVARVPAYSEFERFVGSEESIRIRRATRWDELN
jgi:hypothetical protein